VVKPSVVNIDPTSVVLTPEETKGLEPSVTRAESGRFTGGREAVVAGGAGRCVGLVDGTKGLVDDVDTRGVADEAIVVEERGVLVDEIVVPRSDPTDDAVVEDRAGDGSEAMLLRSQELVGEINGLIPAGHLCRRRCGPDI
jgi:hypothetical protein